MLASLFSFFTSSTNENGHKHGQEKALISPSIGTTGLAIEEAKGHCDTVGNTVDSNQDGCIFCDVSRENGFNVVYEVRFVYRQVSGKARLMRCFA